MAKKELPDEGPSLEMPSLGSLFKRGRKKATDEETRVDADQQPSAEDFERLVKGPKDDEPAVAEELAAADEVAPAKEPPVVEEPVAVEELAVVDEPAPVDEPAVVEEPAVEEELVAAEEPAATSEPIEVAEAPTADAQIAAREVAIEPEVVVAPEPTPAPEPTANSEQFDAPEPAVEQTSVRGMPAVTADGPAEKPAVVEEPAATTETTETTEVIPQLPEHDLIAEAEEPDLGDIEEDDAAPDAVEKTTVAAFKPIPAAPEEPGPQGGARADRRVAASSTTDAESVEAEPAAEEKPAHGPRSFTLPALPSIVAASVTGVLIGILAVALTYFGLRGCEAIRGTSTCGGPGIQILIVNMIILVVVGSMLLKAWKVTDPTSTSFLAVGLLAVISLLFLIEVIFSPSMTVVIPLVSAGTYALSQWVTERFIEEE